MTQALLQANKKIFGSSTEATNYVEGQLSLFKTNEELAKVLIEEQKKITVPSHKRVPRKPGVRAEMLDGLPKEVIDRANACGFNNHSYFTRVFLRKYGMTPINYRKSETMS